MQNWSEFIKSLIRPFIIIWGFIIYGICLVKGVEAPSLLSVLVTAVIFEYFGERAILRFKEKK